MANITKKEQRYLKLYETNQYTSAVLNNNINVIGAVFGGGYLSLAVSNLMGYNVEPILPLMLGTCIGTAVYGSYWFTNIALVKSMVKMAKQSGTINKKDYCYHGAGCQYYLDEDKYTEAYYNQIMTKKNR